jgi:hypothetical protein
MQSICVKEMPDQEALVLRQAWFDGRAQLEENTFAVDQLYLPIDRHGAASRWSIALSQRFIIFGTEALAELLFGDLLYVGHVIMERPVGDMIAEEVYPTDACAGESSQSIITLDDEMLLRKESAGVGMPQYLLAIVTSGWANLTTRPSSRWMWITSAGATELMDVSPSGR